MGGLRYDDKRRPSFMEEEGLKLNRDFFLPAWALVDDLDANRKKGLVGVTLNITHEDVKSRSITGENPRVGVFFSGDPLENQVMVPVSLLLPVRKGDIIVAPASSNFAYVFDRVEAGAFKQIYAEYADHTSFRGKLRSLQFYLSKLLQQKGKNMKFAGKTVVFTGALDFVRADAEAIVHQLGGHVAGTVTASTDYAVIGKRPGSRKMQGIHNFVVPSFDGLQFLREAEQAGSPIARRILGEVLSKKLKEPEAPSFDDLQVSPSPVTPPEKVENAFPTLEDLGFSESLD